MVAILTKDFATCSPFQQMVDFQVVYIIIAIDLFFIYLSFSQISLMHPFSFVLNLTYYQSCMSCENALFLNYKLLNILVRDDDDREGNK